MSEHLESVLENAKALLAHPMVQEIPATVGLTPNALLLTCFVILILARLFRGKSGSPASQSADTVALLQAIQSRSSQGLDDDFRKS